MLVGRSFAEFCFKWIIEYDFIKVLIIQTENQCAFSTTRKASVKCIMDEKCLIWLKVPVSVSIGVPFNGICLILNVNPQIPVNSGRFEDPCVDIYKYLEVEHTCQGERKIHFLLFPWSIVLIFLIYWCFRKTPCIYNPSIASSQFTNRAFLPQGLLWLFGQRILTFRKLIGLKQAIKIVNYENILCS